MKKIFLLCFMGLSFNVFADQPIYCPASIVCGDEPYSCAAKGGNPEYFTAPNIPQQNATFHFKKAYFGDFGVPVCQYDNQLELSSANLNTNLQSHTQGSWWKGKGQEATCGGQLNVLNTDCPFDVYVSKNK